MILLFFIFVQFSFLHGTQMLLHKADCYSVIVYVRSQLLDSCVLYHSEGSGSVKGGGGGNAREIRIRKTKKKGRRDEDSDEETAHASQGMDTDKDIFLVCGNCQTQNNDTG